MKSMKVIYIYIYIYILVFRNTSKATLVDYKSVLNKNVLF